MKKVWWKEGIIYQIYPRSFKDSNGDGIGDLKGIIEKLDYIKSLGVDIIWLGPIYQSPNDDNGYDISDFYSIHPEFGTMDDFLELLDAIHDRGLKLLMDLVVNHTSDEHQWFENSRTSIDNTHRDYYFWKPPSNNGGPPNNWKSFFGGSAWELDAKTGEYYLHLFTKKQPDLNWENEEVRQQVYQIMKFWLDKGIDGFRMDVIPLISKRLEFADTDLQSFNEVVEKVYSNGPKVHEYLQEMNREVLSKYDIMTVGEGPGISTKVGLDYVCEDREELNLIFHLDHMFLGQGPGGKFDPTPFNLLDIKQIFNKWDLAMGETGWNSIFLDNHDFSRMVSRFANDCKYRSESAKMLLTLILTMRGTPCIYQGSEIGMTNVAFESMDSYKDVETLNFYNEQRKQGVDEAAFLPLAHDLSRDNARTPMQWSDGHNAGFTAGKPWIRLNPNYKDINVKADSSDQTSILHFLKTLIAFRKKSPTLVYGKYQDNSEGEAHYFHYKRWDDSKELQIVLNWSDENMKNVIDEAKFSPVLSNYSINDSQKLRPWEARIYQGNA